MSSSPARVAPFFSLQRTSRWTIALFIASILLTLVLITLGYYYSDLLYVENLTEEEEIALLWIGLVGILTAVISLAGWIFFLYWFYKAYKNLKALGATELKSTPRIVIVYFFIPILNLWKPYSAAKEIWYKSGPGALLPSEQGADQSQGPVIVKLWWITLLISLGLSILESVGIVIIYGLSEILSVISEIFLIVLVKDITLRQETKNKMMYR